MCVTEFNVVGFILCWIITHFSHSLALLDKKQFVEMFKNDAVV